MTLKNYEICNIYEAITKVRESEIQFSVKAGYKLAKNAKILLPLYESIIETRDNAFRKYAEETNDGSLIISADKRPAAQNELNELSEIPNEVSLSPLLLSDLEDINLEYSIIEALYPILSDGE